MNPAELLALAQQLLYDCCDPVTGEPLYTGQSSYACVEDVEAAAHYLRDCAEAEPVATVPHGWKLVPIAPTPEMLATTSWPGCAATDYAHMLAAAPQPPSAQPTLTAEIVERRLRTWRQRFVNRSGDQLALDDFLDRESLDDLVDFVCDEYSKEAKR
jgi:hypothetical protein